MSKLNATIAERVRQFITSMYAGRPVNPEKRNGAKEAPSDFVELNCANGLKYELSLPFDAYREAVIGGHTQDSTWKFFMQLVKPGNVLFDLGANLGVFTIPAAALGAEVHAFELLSDNVKRLSASINRNRLTGISLILGAVWDLPTAIGFAGFSAWGNVMAGTRSLIATIVIDEYVKNCNIPRVDIMKIDIEGSEKQALLGSADLIARDHPDIIIESNVLTCGNNGYPYFDLLNHLERFGYRIYRINEGSLSPWNRDIIQEIILVDYFATSRPIEDVSSATGWQICQQTEEKYIENILSQDRHVDLHKVYILSVEEKLPPSVKSNQSVAAMIDSWRHLANHEAIDAIKIGHNA